MPILPYPSVWTLRVPKGSALTHVELDDNQIYLNKKINDTIGQNIGSGIGVYFNKTINPDDGQLLFKSFIGVSGVSVTDSVSAITISSSGNYCDLADGIQVQKVRSCDCEKYQILGNCDCGTIGLRSDGVTFNPNSANSYRFPCYDGPTGYHLQTNGAGVLSWVAGGGTGATSGDSYISNVTLTSGDTICITRSDGYQWCVSLSAVTPYEYGEGFHSIQPRKDINYANATSSNIGGGSGNTVYETGLFSNIGGGQENDIYTKQSFIGGGRYNLIHALPTIATGSTSATTSWTGITYSGLTFSACTGGTWSATTYVTTAHTGTSFTEYAYSAVTFNSNHSSIVGGKYNKIYAAQAFIGGGEYNEIYSFERELFGATIPAQQAYLYKVYSAFTYTGITPAVSGGCSGETYTGITYSGITDTGFTDTILVYSGVTYKTSYSSIMGGERNTVHAYWASIGGGSGNTVTTASTKAIIVGGHGNRLQETQLANIVGGAFNLIESPTEGFTGTTYNNKLSSIVGGYKNQLFSTLTFIGGGSGNTITSASTDSIIVGGQNNLISGATHSATVGGSENKNLGADYSLIGGGRQNVLDKDSDYTLIGGGRQNKIIGTTSDYSSIVSGYLNVLTSSTYTNIVGGVQNIIHNTSFGSIVTGYLNKIYDADYSIIGGGDNNRIEDNGYNGGFIGGGQEHTITGSTHAGVVSGKNNRILGGSNYSIVGGGATNLIDGTTTFASIGGGELNHITAASNYSAIVNGDNNTISLGSQYGFIGAGSKNALDTADWSLVGGGQHNRVISNSDYSNIVGGSGNTVSQSLYVIIGAGVQNRILNSSYSKIGGGDHNRITTTSSHSLIAAGQRNYIVSTSQKSNIVGGNSNTLSASSYSSLVGGLENTIQTGNYSVLGGGRINYILNTQYNVLGGGHDNTILGGGDNGWNVIVGGKGNILGKSGLAYGDYNVIGGGRSNKLSGSSNSNIVGGESNLILGDAAGDTDYAHLGGGASNHITASTFGVIVGGLWNNVLNSRHSGIVGGIQNIHDYSVLGHIGGGSGNTIVKGAYLTQAENSTLVGGRDNIISGSTNSFLGGGNTNLISPIAKETNGNNVLVGGKQNRIVGSAGYSVLVGGLQNKITSLNSSFIGGGDYNQILISTRSTIVGGTSNRIYSTQSYNNIVGGTGNQIGHSTVSNDQAGSSIVGGSGNKIYWRPNEETFKTYNFIGGGSSNLLTGTTSSTVLGGDFNKMYLLDRSVIGGGQRNYMTGATDSVIGGGANNELSGSTISFIGGGAYNKILGRGNAAPSSAAYTDSANTFTNSSILGGYSNTIYHNLTAGGAAIVNGRHNTILAGHDYSVIMGAKGITSDRAYTTFMNGLDVDTNAGDGTQKSFKYHGTFANQGVSRFLKDVTGAGDAQWAELPLVPTMVGDCPVVSAWTIGCILYMFTSGTTSGCTGTTVTANTCDNFTGPYRWKGGIDSISTTLPLVGDPFENIVTAGSRYSNIQGGLKNKVNNAHFAGILNGSGNTITDKAIYSAVVGTRDRSALNPETTYTRGIDANTDGVDGVNRSFKYHGTFAQQGVNRFLKDVTGGGDAQWAELPLIPTTVGDCPVVSAWTVGCILYMFTSGSTSGCTGTTITANTCDNIAGPYRWKGGDKSISTTLPLVADPFENIVTLGSRYSNIQGGLKNKINDTHFAGILNGSGNTIIAKAVYSAIIGTRDRIADAPETTYTRGIDANTDGVDGVNRHFRYHGSVANPGVGKVLTCINAAGDAIWDFGGGILLSGDCAVVSAYTVDCTLYMITNCTGSTGLIVNGNVAYTANTCDFEQGPYVYKGGNGSISTRLPGVGAPGENYINVASQYSNIDGGFDNKINVASIGMSGIFTGQKNIIGGATSANTEYIGWNVIGGGYNNRIHGIDHYAMFIGAGRYNLITGSTDSIIGAGYKNRIEKGATSAGIFTGIYNKIRTKTIGVDSDYSAIVNGSGNTINESAASSAIIGSDARVATTSQTTYVRGLDALTNSKDGDRKFKYHGNWASVGLNKVLMDTDGTGNAQWVDIGVGPGISYSGCPIVSAYTVDCWVVFTNCTGGTMSADTCSSNPQGPYQYGTGLNAIEPVLGGNLADTMYSNIQGGINNKIQVGGIQNVYSSILGGVGNKITGSTLSVISSGQKNRVGIGGSSTLGYGAIFNGYENRVNHQYSVVMGGANISTDRDFTVFMRGLDVDTDATDPLGVTQQSPFKYHGTYAQEGVGKVLMDITGLGDARWKDIGQIPQTSGCPITSAWTSNCTLYLINCTGGTLTADTCNTFGNNSPYEYGAGTDSIKPILGSLQTIPALASIGGGFNNHIPGGRNARIGGGTQNIISGSTDGGILAGYGNMITQSQQSSIGGGRMNTIGTESISSQWSFIGGGKENDIKGNYGYNFVGGGQGNKLGTTAWSVGLGWSTIGGGSGNEIYGPYLTSSTIAGGGFNVITGTSSSFIGGGSGNMSYDTGKTAWTTIVGGRENKIDRSSYGFIGAGIHNKIINGATLSSIVGGSGNTIGPITTATYSNIQGGRNNKIGGDGPVEYGSIVNGKDNLVQHDYSVIMGSRGITTDRVHTTFVTGLDANTVDADGGTQLFRYHGAPAAPGINKVLVDSTGFGDAVWADAPGTGIGGWTGDCAVVSAFTQGCLLYMVTNCTGGTGSAWILVNGNITYTADTCNSFSESPYRYGSGVQTIIPKLPIGPLGNHTSTNSQWSNITGGIMNSVSAFTSTIGGGYFNKIESGSAHFIGSGFMNVIYLGANQQAAGGFSSIVGGSGNYISANTTTNTGWHFIGGGQSNTIMGTAIQFNSILGGNQNAIHIDNSYANVVGGFHNKIKRGSNYSSILTGDRNLIDYNSQWSSILAGSGNTIYGESGVNHGAIVNGRFNRVQHDSSAVIGADRRFTEQSHVTYTNGVDIDSDLDTLIGGTRYLKYHGSLASPGLNRVLTDVDGLGNAVWQRIPGAFNWTGDCGIVSAFTTNNGCTLNLINCTGGTVTADTCNEVTGPYAYRGGSGSISTTLPLPLAANENLIGPFTTNSNIDGGLDNKIYSKGRNHAILGGFNNRIGTLTTSAQSNTHHAIVGGTYNKITGVDTHYSIIGGGYTNILYQSTSSGVFSGYENEISESGFAVIAGGYRNTINSFVNYSLIGGGQQNKIIHTKSDWGSIVGGQSNILTSEGDSENYRAFIGGGYTNFISGSSDSSIVGGSGNEINSGSRNIIGGGIDNTIGNSDFTGILNGSGNTVNNGHQSSAIIGGDGLSTDKSHTTFMNGLDVNTQAVNGISRYFKYHGTLSNNGALGQVLTDVTGTGEATWQPIPTFPNVANLTGCSIVSAYTTNQGCDLNLIDCTGGTYTVDICSTFTQGPYQFGAGANAIEPVLGGNQANTTYSNIQGGINNKIANFGIQNVYSSIVGGIGNRITGSTLSLIGSGQKNKVFIGGDSTKGYGTVLNGFENKVVNQYSVIMGGANMTTNRDFTVFMRGLDVDTDATDPLGVTQNSPFKYHGVYANPGINKILTDIDGTGNAVWMPCSTACSGSTGGATGTTKHVDIRNYTANVKETISHGLSTEDVIVNIWTENKQKIDAEVFYVNANQIEVAVSMDLNNVKTVIIG